MVKNRGTTVLSLNYVGSLNKVSSVEVKDNYITNFEKILIPFVCFSVVWGVHLESHNVTSLHVFIADMSQKRRKDVFCTRG